MKRICGKSKSYKLTQEDFISRMPDDVITNILDRLPLQDVVRTSVLSRNWRFKWTIITQLVFDDKFYDFLRKTKHEKNYERIISRLLLNHKGAITKFFLTIFDYLNNIDEDIAHWILFLSTKGVKDLTIRNTSEALKVPAHVFSCLELKHLNLDDFYFDPPTGFHGFPNLLSLELSFVGFESGKFGELFAQCPLREILNLGYTCYEGNVKPSEITKLTNLKKLSLALNNLDNTMITSFSSIFELLCFIPKLQELNLDFRDFKFTEDGARKWSPTTFPCLQTLKLSYIELRDGVRISIAFEIIRSFMNLQTLEITTSEWDVDPSSVICSQEVDYNSMEMLQLKRVVFKEWKASKNEVCFIKRLLVCSPFLEEIDIHPYLFLSRGKLKFTRKLLKPQIASGVAKIILG